MSAILFSDTAGETEFLYYDRVPADYVKLRLKKGPVYKVNIASLHLYGLYRNSIFNSYREKKDVAQDIQEHKNEYHEAEGFPRSPLYQYSVAVAIDTVKKWQQSDENMKCLMAFRTNGKKRKKIGFVHFTETEMSGKKVVYIAQAGVTHRGKGVGRCLMECVLSHFPAGTEFYILTRVFNTEAKTLYEKRLKFTPIEMCEIEQLGYDARYCGFQHTTTDEEILEIRSRQIF